MSTYTMQQKTLAVVDELEQYAVQENEKQRVLDIISEIREKVVSDFDNQSVPKVVSEIDNIVQHFQRQEIDKNEYVIDEFTKVTKKEIQQRIQEIIAESHQATVSVRNQYILNEDSTLKQIKVQMNEIANMNINYNYMHNPNAFCDFFSQIAYKMRQQVCSSVKECIAEMGNGYHHAMEYMNGILKEIKSKNIHTCQRQLYQYYDKDRNLIMEEVLKKADTFDFGTEEIENFGVNQMHSIQKIVKKQKRIRFHKILLPIYIVVAFFLFNAIMSADIFTGNRETTQTLVEQTEEKDIVTIVQNADAVVKHTNSIIKNLKPILSRIGVYLVYVVAVIISIIVIAYYLYIRHVNKRYHLNIKNECSKLLNECLNEFWQETDMQKEIANAFVLTEELLLEKYKTMIKNVLAIKQEKIETSDVNQIMLTDLTLKWQELKQTVEEMV